MTEVPSHVPFGGWEGVEGIAYEATKVDAYRLQGRRVSLAWTDWGLVRCRRPWYAPWREVPVFEQIENVTTGVLTVEDHTEAMNDQVGCAEHEWIALIIDGQWRHYLDPSTEIIEVQLP